MSNNKPTMLARPSTIRKAIQAQSVSADAMWQLAHARISKQHKPGYNDNVSATAMRRELGNVLLETVKRIETLQMVLEESKNRLMAERGAP